MIRTIFSVVALLAAGVIFFMYTQPTYGSLSLIKGEIDQYNKALEKADELKKQKEELLKKFNAIDQESKDRLLKLLPNHVDNVRLILDIDGLAGAFNIPLKNVAINSSETDETGKSVIKSISSGKQKYDSLTLKFATESTYPEFVRFIEALQASLRIVDIVSLNVAPGASGGGIYQYTVTIKTYWLR
ncbi:MAG: hypothetical protein UY63_C0004G0017 [Parcubacteria group bacterium GW2011_GWA2_51_10]|nr:MAG: hypothetical protein UY63_C0004G0017 [Parcubacteria group bacterium GW2011_GWA2_51_10]